MPVKSVRANKHPRIHRYYTPASPTDRRFRLSAREMHGFASFAQQKRIKTSPISRAHTHTCVSFILTIRSSAKAIRRTRIMCDISSVNTSTDFIDFLFGRRHSNPLRRGDKNDVLLRYPDGMCATPSPGVCKYRPAHPLAFFSSFYSSHHLYIIGFSIHRKLRVIQRKKKEERIR